MKVESVQTAVYRIPPSTPWEDASGPVPVKEWILAEVETDRGVRGIGWSYTVGYGGTAIKVLIDDYLAPLVIGEDPLLVPAIWEKLRWAVRGIGREGISSLALAALDVALWDTAAKIQGQPLHRVLGSLRNEVPVYASGIDLSRPIDDLLEQVEEHLCSGYEAIKIKVGKVDPIEDAERVRAVRKLIGPSRQLMVDANQKWTVAEALRRVKMFNESDVSWVEEPLMADDLEGYGHLRSRLHVPIAMGETLWSQRRFAEYIKRGVCDVVQADVARVGGITEWMRIAAVAESANLPMAPHGLMEISVHVLCAVPNSLFLEHQIGGSLTEMGIIEVPISPSKGYLTAQHEPGHGVQFDHTALSKYRVVKDTTSLLHDN